MTKYNISKEIRTTAYYIVEAEDDDDAHDYISDGQGTPYHETTQSEKVTCIEEISDEEATTTARVWGVPINVVSYDE